jgi:hypothetical protein
VAQEEVERHVPSLFFSWRTIMAVKKPQLRKKEIVVVVFLFLGWRKRKGEIVVALRLRPA